MNLAGTEESPLSGGVFEGDCLPRLRALPDGCVDLVFSDPPFNIGYGYDVYKDRRSAEEYLTWCASWGAELVRALKPSGSLWLAIGDEYAAELKVLFHRELGLSLRSWVVWYYTFGVNCERKFSRSHTHLFYFTRCPDGFTFNADAVKVPSAREAVYKHKRARAGGRLPDDTWVLRPQDAPEVFTAGEDTWHVPRVCGTFRERQGWHGCQMPERVLARVIGACSNPGDVVLDPMCGSGTALVVARKLGRVPVGFELSPEYASRARERLSTATPGDPIAGDESVVPAAKLLPQASWFRSGDDLDG
jgi:site-specific DNA-methyltransferase (adenine-specific)